VTSPLGQTASRGYDAAGRLTAATTPLGRTTGFQYNALNAVTQITDPLGGVTQFAYDPNGNLLALTDARGGTTAYTYDSMDRVAARTDPLAHPETSTYDLNGNPIGGTDRKSQGTGTTYDALNRPTLVTYQDGSTTAYTWDAGNRLTQVVDSLGGTITRTYDGLDRLTQEVTPQGTVSYTYDAAGRRTSLTVLGQPSVTYAYDNADRLAQITQGGATVDVTYDDANRRTSLTLPNGVSTEYGYDAASRLTGLTYKLGGTTLGTLTYAYDAAGNRTGIGGTWARTGLPAALTTATYDAANRQLTRDAIAQAFDLNGNLTSDGALTYAWDARNRLVGLSGAATATFQYDALGRRAAKTVNGAQTGFLYDGLNPVQELTNSTPTATLLTGLGIDEYLTRTDPTTTWQYLTDALGSTVALTDPAGSVQASYTYQPFGARTTTGTPGTNTFEYTGRENDGTGLQYYRARYYHPSMARFASEDPARFVGENAYLYAYGNPVKFVDPLGLDVIVRLFCCHLGNPAGHVGAAIDRPGIGNGESRGFYPTGNPLNSPGAVVRDADKWDLGVKSDAVRIPTTREMDRRINDSFDRLAKDPGRYRLWGRNCATTIQDTLRAVGIDTGPQTRYPAVLMDRIQQYLESQIPL
jgi:RHS repeat-associated protein